MYGYNIKEALLSQIKLPKEILIRQFVETDFPLVKTLYAQEGWMTFINREGDALEAWNNSNITLVAVEGDKVIGLVRALTDGKITTYIAEIIVDTRYRGKGIGKALLDVCHGLYPHTRLDLLSTEGADEFYKNNKFREITGFRKSYY
ncbi:GNAT family N-acetyltransferase [Brassicibacter mesophilus]|uniref:GNAT family N-acetyltransferase n=1 Tax=Brassicibacter mesophilus TaxID=745119 RepID=UPI003D2102D7